MNQTFNGFMLLGIVLLITIVLFTIAYFMKPKQTSDLSHKTSVNRKKTKTSLVTQKSPVKNVPKFRSKKGSFKMQANSQLTTLKKRVTKNFPEFTATLRQNYLILERASEKVAMLTIDKAAAMGRRRLGEVTVINFHDLPSVEELKIELSGM